MNFSGTQSLIKKANSKALEAQVFNRVANVEDEPMNISIITDKMIEDNELKEVSNPVYFDRGGTPTVDGLYSEYIFGTTTEERMKTYAYIDLHQKFFHPYVFEVLKKLYRHVERIAAGQSAWHIQDNGELEEIKDSSSQYYDEDATGLQWLIDNYHKIKFKENDSSMRKNNLKFIRSLSDDELFITKWIVIPPFYRDVEVAASGRPQVHELSMKYSSLIKYSNAIKNSGMSFFNNSAMYNIEMTLVDIRKYGQSLIEKKHGTFHQAILGKSTDYGSRLVISVPVMNKLEKPEDCQVDIYHTGIPLSQCCVLGYPFIIKWCMDFFQDEFDGVKTKVLYRKNKATGEITQEEVEIADQLAIFTKDYIDKKIKSFKNTYGNRFETIKIRLKDGSDTEMIFTGRGFSRNIQSSKAATIAYRPMTWTDLFYLAAVNTLSDKHVYVTRYPLESYFGIFPTRCTPLSTLNTEPMVVDGKVYPFYPVIELSLSEKEVAMHFIDTCEIANVYLDAIDGDYDGDQISVKMVYSVEANKEAEDIINSLKHFISIKGNIVRTMKNEVNLCFYSMTKY